MQEWTDDQLCDTCHQIDLEALLESLSRGLWSEGDSPPYVTMTYSEGCKLCQLLLHDDREPCVWEPSWELRAVSHFNSATPTDWGYNKLARTYDGSVTGSDSYNLVAVPKGRNFWLPDTSTGIFCSSREEPREGLFQPRAISRGCDYSIARSWLKNCIDFHGCDGDNVSSLIPGMRLIDCHDLNVVAATSSSRWIALSYVWGPQSQPDKADVAGSSYLKSTMTDLTRFPKTVQDAIIVTKELGYQYLWVDEFCIDQKDETHRLDQIQKMDRICRSAHTQKISKCAC